MVAGVTNSGNRCFGGHQIRSLLLFAGRAWLADSLAPLPEGGVAKGREGAATGGKGDEEGRRHRRGRRRSRRPPCPPEGEKESLSGVPSLYLVGPRAEEGRYRRRRRPTSTDAAGRHVREAGDGRRDEDVAGGGRIWWRWCCLTPTLVVPFMEKESRRR